MGFWLGSSIGIWLGRSMAYLADASLEGKGGLIFMGFCFGVFFAALCAFLLEEVINLLFQEEDEEEYSDLP